MKLLPTSTRKQSNDEWVPWWRRRSDQSVIQTTSHNEHTQSEHEKAVPKQHPRKPVVVVVEKDALIEQTTLSHKDDLYPLSTSVMTDREGGLLDELAHRDVERERRAMMDLREKLARLTAELKDQHQFQQEHQLVSQHPVAIHPTVVPLKSPPASLAPSKLSYAMKPSYYRPRRQSQGSVPEPPIPPAPATAAAAATPSSPTQTPFVQRRLAPVYEQRTGVDTVAPDEGNLALWIRQREQTIEWIQSQMESQIHRLLQQVEDQQEEIKMLKDQVSEAKMGMHRDREQLQVEVERLQGDLHVEREGHKRVMEQCRREVHALLQDQTQTLEKNARYKEELILLLRENNQLKAMLNASLQWHESGGELTALKDEVERLRAENVKGKRLCRAMMEELGHSQVS